MRKQVRKEKRTRNEAMDHIAAQMAELMAEENMDMMEMYREMLGRVAGKTLDEEIDHHLGYRWNGSPGPEQKNRRNGKTLKRVRTSLGEVEVAVPRDREGSFEPRLVPKYKRSIEEFDHKMLALYARGMSV